MTSWLIETLAWTAALLAVVLVIRRPVARWFGPQLAYALWLLPLVRLVIPPITLPAWLASAEPAVTAPAAPSAATDGITYEIIAEAGAPAAVAVPMIDWTLLLLAVWLGGTTIFLTMRFSAYFKMRAMLLDNAIPVGEAGNIRLVESAATSAPLAFGVLDRVIALPESFMASEDRTARDLALEHELTHHKGGDLLINFAIQPLFALHWFNPLAYAGWRAMRRDQEAACDARVVANRDAAEKATYGEVIANFAAAPTLNPGLTLAAPMACPVLGDKSIIQRLRSLTMSDISPRRRVAGRLAIGAAVLALPLTASITYAEVIAPSAPAAPDAPSVSAIVPAAPAAPTAPTLLASPPAPPAAPIAPVAALLSTELHPEDGDGRRVIRIERDIEEANGDGQSTVIVRRVHSEDGQSTEETSEHRLERRVIISGDHGMSEDEIELLIENAERGVSGQVSGRHTVRMRFDQSSDDGDGQMSSVMINCRGADGTSVTSESAAACSAEALGQALIGLRAAREELADNDVFSAEMRAEILRELDTEIARLEE